MYKKTIDINKILICALLCCSLLMLNIVSVPAQTLPTGNNNSSSQLDAKAQEMKDRIIKIGKNNDITIIGKNKREFYGAILEIKDDSVSIDEIDQKVIVEIKYREINKVRKGYGLAKNRFGNRIPTRRHLIAIAAVAGLLALPIILLANSKD